MGMDVFTHMNTRHKFVEFKDEFELLELVHQPSGVTWFIPEQVRHQRFCCYENDEISTNSIKIKAGSPSRGLDDLVECIVADVKEVSG